GLDEQTASGAGRAEGAGSAGGAGAAGAGRAGGAAGGEGAGRAEGAGGGGVAAAAGAQGAAAAAGGGRGGGAPPYWGKYVSHDNNRDINLSQVSMRAIVDWYYTAHPPIMHDLHEAQPLLYTFSGGPPQNPNLDPILFAELPFFSNFELEQMTKYGIPGVYTHAFMDGWSPGYCGSVTYNHNGRRRMYETQSGRENAPGPAGAGGAGGAGNAAAGGAAGSGSAGARGSEGSQTTTPAQAPTEGGRGQGRA